MPCHFRMLLDPMFQLYVGNFQCFASRFHFYSFCHVDVVFSLAFVVDMLCVFFILRTIRFPVISIIERCFIAIHRNIIFFNCTGENWNCLLACFFLTRHEIEVKYAKLEIENWHSVFDYVHYSWLCQACTVYLSSIVLRWTKKTLKL